MDLVPRVVKRAENMGLAEMVRYHCAGGAPSRLDPEQAHGSAAVGIGRCITVRGGGLGLRYDIRLRGWRIFPERFNCTHASSCRSFCVFGLEDQTQYLLYEGHHQRIVECRTLPAALYIERSIPLYLSGTVYIASL